MDVEEPVTQVPYPAELLGEMGADEVNRLAREALYVRLYQLGRLSSGEAGRLLGLTRSDFLDLLGAYGVSYFDDATNLAEDWRHAHDAHA
ncbi:MAG TPA: UPF0175 family protein [Ktedonobacterales bacterium]|nr:UPF0175 family protein [Ktedonobacterales bacterium]